MLETAMLRLEEAFFPSRCMGCGVLCRDPGVAFCWVCAQGLWPLQRPWCGQCGRPLEGRPEDPRLCLGCVARPPPYDRLQSAFFYGGPLADAIIAFKHGGHAEYGARLGQMLLNAGEVRLPTVDLVVPVPLHPRRARQRGYNQARLLAKVVARAANVPLREMLRRVRDTGSQKGRTREERFAELAGSFRATGSRRVEGRRILLVDDVVTTGATVQNCAAALRSAGASEISVVSLARAR